MVNANKRIYRTNDGKTITYEFITQKKFSYAIINDYLCFCSHFKEEIHLFYIFDKHRAVFLSLYPCFDNFFAAKKKIVYHTLEFYQKFYGARFP